MISVNFQPPFLLPTAIAIETIDIDTLEDVKKNHWSFSAIELIVQDLGIMSAKSTNKFAGDDTSTRYEVADAFVNAARKLESISGLDLKINAKKKKVPLIDVDIEHNNVVDEVINSYGLMQLIPGSKFMGNRAITRFELAYDLNNYLHLLEKVVAKKNKPEINRMEKLNDVRPGHWATEAVKDIVNKYQIMKGYPDNQFKGGNTLTRYELVAVLKKFIDYIDRYLIPIPKATSISTAEPMPTPLPTPVIIPFQTPKQIPFPTPSPDNRITLGMVDAKVGLMVNVSYSGPSTNNEIDTLSGPNANINIWFPKYNGLKFGLGLNGYFLSYGKILNQYHNVSNLRRSSIGLDFDWRILGFDYIDEQSLTLGIGYGMLQWSGAGYSYGNHGPKARISYEYPIIPFLSIFADEQFHFMLGENSQFTDQLLWINDFVIGINIMAINQISLQIGYKDSRFSLGKSEVFGDIGGIANIRFRY